MKTIIYLSLICLMIHQNLSAQQYPPGLDPSDPRLHPGSQFRQKFLRPEGKLMPVYFNYSRRLLFYNNTIRLNGNDFLNMCRSIDDVQIKRQIARYDELSRKKKVLVGMTIVCGVGGYITAVTAATISNYNSGQTAFLVTGLACLLATPILAVSTSIPHQKRKEVVFRDLPYAYNLYVGSQNK
jgi:hypothetical protein